jgi:AsmA protein
MSAKFVFVDGVATNDDFDVKSPLLRVRGSGSANLRQDTVDYLVDAELVKACDGQSGASADKLVGVPLPIREKGLFVSPKIPPD